MGRSRAKGERRASHKKPAPARPKAKRVRKASPQGAVQKLKRELKDARQQQIATADILKAISRSSFDLQRLLETLTVSAARVCRADMAAMTRQAADGFYYHVTNHNFHPDWVQAQKSRPLKPGRDSVVGRVLLENKPVHIVDVLADPDYTFLESQKLAGFRTFMGVPLIRDGRPIGVFTLGRRSVDPFTEDQIRLVTSFADHAVIAMENARLLDELQGRTGELTESLEQQTATAAVLRVISSSPGELQPVLDAVVSTARRMCNPDFAVLFRLVDGKYHIAAADGADPDFVQYLREHPISPGPGTMVGRTALERRTIYIEDAPNDPTYAWQEAVQRGHYRTTLGVPLLRDGAVVGVIGLVSGRPSALKRKQVELVETFAAQAVIAMENVRLFEETRARTRELTEALERQTATSDVLNVISRSSFHLQPVLDTIVEVASRLCEAEFGTIFKLQDGKYHVAAATNTAESFIQHAAEHPIVPVRGSLIGRTALEGMTVHLPDCLADPEYTFLDYQAVGKYRSMLGVPLLREGAPVGVIGLMRTAVKPFTEKQIELVTTFADQAVIAIENVRLFDEVQARTRELTEALEQQTATSEVLKAISRSGFDLQAILETVLENAIRLCGATRGHVFRFDGEFLHLATASGSAPGFTEHLRANPFRPDLRSVSGRAVIERQICHVHDVLEEENYGYGELMRKDGFRTVLAVPMLKEGELLGVIAILKSRVEPFTDKQIELITTFSDQAVIAIENGRLLGELRESLQQQTATADVLKVISRSAFDLQRVFETVAESAVALCGADRAFIFRFDGEVLRVVVAHNASQALKQFTTANPIRPGRHSGAARCALERRTIHIRDVRDDPEYSYGAKTVDSVRTVLTVPMLKGEELLGVILVYHLEVRPFTEKQIALVETFADQAAIAIENVRLLSELRESLQQQTATADVLKVISRSAFDLQRVFETVGESAVSLCEAYRAFIYRFDGEFLRSEVAINASPELREFVAQNPVRPGRESCAARCALERRTVHILDVTTDPEYTYRSKEIDPLRTVLSVPMLKGDDLLGVILIYHLEVRPFTEKQIALIETFADQAVIAIENVRLLSELRESLQQQTATADVLKVISRSTFDLETVLQTLVESAAHLCEADQGTITRQQDGVFFRAATYGFSSEFTEVVTRLPVEVERGSATGRALAEGRIVHIPDIELDPDYTFAEGRKLGGFRTILAVPMLREGVPSGVLTLTRIEVRPFTEKQIELVSTFADQAAIAIENVRLFESVEARTRELQKSLEDLRTAQDRLVQTEKLASLGQLTAGIAHEIKNPLNFVNNFAALSTELVDEIEGSLEKAGLSEGVRAEVEETATMLRGNLDKIVQHGKRADSIVKNMLLHSRQGTGEHRPADVNAIVEESLNLAYHGARAERQGFNITLEKFLDPAAGEVDLFPQEITRVLLNLISNGFYAATRRKALEQGNGYEPKLAAATRNLGDSVEITIRDNGTGIPQEVRDKIFNPFFTTKPAGEGTGLGLSLSHDIVVKQHAGSISVDTEPGQFTEFRIVLPRRAAAIAEAGARS